MLIIQDVRVHQSGLGDCKSQIIFVNSPICKIEWRHSDLSSMSETFATVHLTSVNTRVFKNCAVPLDVFLNFKCTYMSGVSPDLMWIIHSSTWQYVQGKKKRRGCSKKSKRNEPFMTISDFRYTCNASLLPGFFKTSHSLTIMRNLTTCVYLLSSEYTPFFLEVLSAFCWSKMDVTYSI